MAADIIMPKRKARPKKEKVSDATISDTACRVGMICGLLMGVNEEACKHLEKMFKDNPTEYLYGKETKIVREARRKFFKKGAK
jgi:hypothetical protein